MGIFTERNRDRYRERQREMYFQLFLLIAPAFGMPSKSAGGGGEVNEFQSLIDFSRETGDLLDNSQWIKEVFESLEKTEKNLLDLEVELKTMPYADKTGVGLEDDLFPEYNNAKRYLRETGQKLREFAYKTVAEARDLKTLFVAVDESQDSGLLQIAIKKMTGFMSDTVEIFREANEKYQTAKKTFVDLKNSSTGSKDKVQKMLNTDSAEYREWVKVVSEAVKEEFKYSERVQNLTDEIHAHFAKDAEENEKAEKIEKAEENAKAEENEMAEPEIEKTDIQRTGEVKKLNDGTHSAYAAGINAIEERVKAQTEAAIERYNAKLGKLKEFIDSMLESGNNFEETIDNAMGILTEKIEKITKSTESANLVSENKETFLTKFQDISSDLTTELDYLKKSAETFLARES